MDKTRDNCGNCNWSAPDPLYAPDMVECRGDTPKSRAPSLGDNDGEFPRVDKNKWCRHHTPKQLASISEKSQPRPPIGDKPR